MRTVLEKIIQKRYSARGKHMLLELYGCSEKTLDDEKLLNSIMENAAIKANATILKTVSHKFQPQGVTSMILLAESHISIHTWPEDGYAAVDLFTCSQSTDFQLVSEYLITELKAESSKKKLVTRGSY